MKSLDVESQFAFNYFSDHTDGDLLYQEIDFVSPGEKADKILFSTIKQVKPAHGHDAAEAIECALWKACDINFNEAEEKHLYLITDVVAHGMGLTGDDGCPLQRDWRDSLKRVNKTFDSFIVIGCADMKEAAELQKKFLAPERLAWDFIDISEVQESYHRMALTVNAILFAVARNLGKQAVEMFLGFLYEKWLNDPVFGADTDRRAKEGIRRFGKYIEAPPDEVEKTMRKVLAE